MRGRTPIPGRSDRRVVARGGAGLEPASTPSRMSCNLRWRRVTRLPSSAIVAASRKGACQQAHARDRQRSRRCTPAHRQDRRGHRAVSRDGKEVSRQRARRRESRHRARAQGRGRGSAQVDTESVIRDVHEHEGSEWLHVRILKAKIALAKRSGLVRARTACWAAISAAAKCRWRRESCRSRRASSRARRNCCARSTISSWSARNS